MKKKVLKKSQKKSQKPFKETDFERVRTFLEKAGLPYEAGLNESTVPYLFINFDDEGKAILPL